jgi:Tfp pilus assembly protein PilX
MNKQRVQKSKHAPNGTEHRHGERGSAIVIALLIMGLLMVFVTLALSRTTTEAMIMGNDAANARAFYAAQASLEVTTRNFNKIFDTKLTPTLPDLTNIQTNTSTQNSWQSLFPDYTFTQTISPNDPTKIKTQNNVTIASGPYQGLKAARDVWQITSTATGPTGAEVQLTRDYYSNKLPIFQFGAFYEHDMDFWPGPAMYMGGRVHTNGNLYMSASAGLHFQSRVTAAREIVHDKSRNGGAMYYDDNVFVTDGGTGEVQVTQGSVINGPNIPGYVADPAEPDEPSGTTNTNWNTFSAAFNGNLTAHAPKLKMPLQNGGNDPVEIIKRGKDTDNNVLSASRYYNKACIRITLDDSQANLPGGTGGVRLDGDANGSGTQTPLAVRGYLPTAMTGGYQATRINGYRLYTGASYGGVASRQTWIKVELVTPNLTTPSTPTVTDITKDFLSLGMTEPDVFQLDASGNPDIWAGDTRSIVRIQRYRVDGPPIKVNDILDSTANTQVATAMPDQKAAGLNTSVYTYVSSPKPTSVTTPYSVVTNTDSFVSANEINFQFPNALGITANASNYVKINSSNKKIIPFPIEMFDVREGLFDDDLTNANWNTLYQPGATGSNDNVPWRGVMSVIDIDMGNLRQFLNGAWDGAFPNGLTSAQIPKDAQGVILYVSDRRGDADSDGIYDMENIYVASASDTTGLQSGEDISGATTVASDGTLQADYTWESCRYSDAVPADVAAVSEQPWPGAIPTGLPAGTNLGHKFYRRAIRLVNGSQLWGTTTQGLTVATENGAYIFGDYNATAKAADPVGGVPTPPSGYTAGVPSSVVADGITILSNAWNDGKSFRNPFKMNSPLPSNSGRTVPSSYETTIRTALLMGTTKHSLITSPNQGGSTGPNGGTLENIDGGVNNFPRLLEDWQPSGATQLNYCGSMISLFYSHVQNGSFKGHNGASTVVNTFLAPDRNWNFDTNFLDPTKNPPGTPYLQYVQVTGFRRTNN